MKTNSLEKNKAREILSVLRKKTKNKFRVEKWKDKKSDWSFCADAVDNGVQFFSVSFCGLKEIADEVEKELKNEK